MQQYEHYKESGVDWIGQIPAHWEVKRLKNEFLIISGNGFKIDLQGCELGEIPVCKASDISIAGKILNKSKNYLSKITAIKEGFNIIPAKSIVFAKIGEAMKKNNRSILSFESCLDNNCQALVPKRINHIFAYYVLTIIDMCWYDNGGTIPCVNNQKLMIENIPLPPLAEQTAIAHFLDTKCEQIDRAVAQKEKVVELLNERRQILIQRAVTRGLNPEVELRDSGIDWIGQIPAHWEVLPIKRIVQVKDGTHDTPEYIYKSDISYPLITSKDFINDDIDFNDAKHISDKDYNKIIIRSNVEKLDVLMSMIGGNIGKSVIVNNDEKFAIKNVALFKTRSKLALAKYIKYYLNSGLLDIQISLKSRGGAQDFLGLNDIRNLTFIKIPNDEIDYIIIHLDNVNEKIDRAIALKREEIEKLKEYKQTLINSAVTGKIKIA